jgi:ABC-type branched-subunit amino acid transport system permease subunit
MNRYDERTVLIKRFFGCLAGGVVFALMWGPQEGNQNDYGYAFRQSVFKPRIFVFLAIGVLAFLAITYWSHFKGYLTRPGAWPLAAGAATVLAAMTLLHWEDSVGNAKFSDVASAAKDTNHLAFIASAFFGWLAWAQLAILVVALGVAAVRRIAPLAWIALVGCVIAGIDGLVAHEEVAKLVTGHDHSLGSASAALGYVVMASAAVVIATTGRDTAATRAFVDRAFAWRPGLLLVIGGVVAGVIALVAATWFAPSSLDTTLHKTYSRFQGYGLSPLVNAYLGWLAYVLLAAAAVTAGAGCWLKQRSLSWFGAAIGLVAVILSLVTIYDVSKVGAQNHVDAATGPWQNLGAGGWLACIAFFCIGAGGFLAATSSSVVKAPAFGQRALAVPTAPGTSTSTRLAGGATASRSLIMLGIAIALFYPPTTTLFWQKVLVGEIGVYVLLAVGLNVVVGWAGLLDLGFIAFYAIGSYTTAYLVGSLPIKPPAWLHMSPLLAIPFAVAICLLAGIALGAPTLRLRGDYLAIVTLGFGEIIRIIAVNADNITNSTRGPSPPVPNPVIHIGPLHITWGLAQLQYWYLLLVFILVVVVLFYRLEGSRLGRAWAAIREDEVAAQATGINTARVKLLAFAIGASTSGLAGVFFASQVGYFNPDNFVLNNSILVVAYVVFGGMGSLPGAMAGAAVLTWLPEFLKDQVPAVDRQMWIGAVVLAMMIFRPAGLIPAKRRKAELHGLDGSSSAETRAVPAGEGL